MIGLKVILKPDKLPHKLKRITEDLPLSRNELVKRVGFGNAFDRSTVSHYESGERELPLSLSLGYARLANIYVDTLIDDNLDLPEPLPCREKSAGIDVETAK